jgi:hypothetical protein
MKIGRISRRTFALKAANDSSRPRAEILRTTFAVALAVGVIGTGAIALPSLSPVEAGIEIPPSKGPQLEPELLADIEGIHEEAGMLGRPVSDAITGVAKSLPSTAAKVARATTAVAKPIAIGVEAIPATIARATAHEAIKMKKGIIPHPVKFARAQDGITIPVSLTQYCVQGETRRPSDAPWHRRAADRESSSRATSRSSSATSISVATWSTTPAATSSARPSTSGIQTARKPRASAATGEPPPWSLDLSSKSPTILWFQPAGTV